MPKVFYSWQADHPAKTGRNLVHRALEDAINQLNSDADVEEAARETIALDRDTQNVPGSPPIVDTIFRKIDEAMVFVADLTFVGRRVGGKPTPNPNVAIEYGYALKALSHAKIVAVMNAAHGEPTRDSLPFDLGHMRFPLTYSCADDADEETRRQERKRLAASLKGALKAVFDADVQTVSARPAYAPQAPMSGQARFRPAGERVGILHDGSILPRPEVNVEIAAGPAMWLRVFPASAPGARVPVTALREAMVNRGGFASPLNGRDILNPYGIRGEDGYGLAHAAHEGVASMIVYAFSSGEIWSIDAATLNYDANRIFFSVSNFSAALAEYAEVLKRVGVDGPFRWIAGIEGIKGRGLYIEGRSYPFPPANVLRDTVMAQGEYSGEASEAPAAIEPFVAEVYDAGQLARR